MSQVIELLERPEFRTLFIVSPSRKSPGTLALQFALAPIMRYPVCKSAGLRKRLLIYAEGTDESSGGFLDFLLSGMGGPSQDS